MTPTLQQFLPSIPAESAAAIGWIASAGALIGLALWLFGSRFSRQLVALVAVAAGAALGLQVPRWIGVTIASWSTATVGALILGVIGYIFHKGFVRIGLAILLAAWGIFAAWLLYAPDSKLKLPTRGDSTKLWDYALQFWNALPPDLRISAPLGAGAGLLIASILAFLLPRLAISLFYSLIGFCLMTGLGFLSLSQFRPQLLSTFPNEPRTQLISMAVAIAFGTLLQWWLHPRPRPAAQSGNSQNQPSADKGKG